MAALFFHSMNVPAQQLHHKRRGKDLVTGHQVFVGIDILSPDFLPKASLTSALPDDSLGRDNRYEALMENNVRVSAPILEAMSREAQRTGVEVNGLFDEAAKQLLAHREVDELASIGERHARRRGLKPSDSVRLVREDRNQQRSR